MQLAIQLIGVVVILAWSAGLTAVFASVASRLGVLRMRAEKETAHYEAFLFANKAEEGFAAVVNYNKAPSHSYTYLHHITYTRRDQAFTVMFPCNSRTV